MHLILSYPTGRRVEAILLAASRECMRVVVKRLNETLELRLIDGQWSSVEGTHIEIESMVADGALNVSAFVSHFNHRTSRAAN